MKLVIEDLIWSLEYNFYEHQHTTWYVLVIIFSKDNFYYMHYAESTTICTFCHNLPNGTLGTFPAATKDVSSRIWLKNNFVQSKIYLLQINFWIKNIRFSNFAIKAAPAADVMDLMKKLPIFYVVLLWLQEIHYKGEGMG